MPNPLISKITLPNGTTYDIKDAYAREMIAGGVRFIVAWDGNDTPVVANIPAGVTVYYGDPAVAYTGTLSVSAAQAGTFYLVKSSTEAGGVLDYYDEYVVVGPAGSQAWERLGNTEISFDSLGSLAWKNTVTLNKGVGDTVLGTSTTFTNSSSNVTFSGGTDDSVLGANTSFSLSGAPQITVTPSTTDIAATASGTTVGGTGTASAITGFGDHTTDNFIKSVTANTSKLVTTSITPTNGTESVSKVTQTASKLVTTSIPNVTNVTPKTLQFALGTGNDAETLIIDGSGFTGNTYTADVTTLGTAITAATGSVDAGGTGSDIVTAVSISDKTVAKAGTAITVATGSLDADATGATIATGLASPTTAAALTALGTPTTSACLTGVEVTTQPTISLSTGATHGATGTVEVATGISSATSSTPTISVGSDDLVTALTSVGTATAAGQTITVGSNDQVDVAVYNDLSVSVS